MFGRLVLGVRSVLVFAVGGAAMYAQPQPARRFYMGEIAFQVLSLVSKGILGALLITNVLLLSRFEEIFDGM